MAALTTLSFSDNVDLQRSAALAFAEITEKEVREVGRDTLDPVLYLLTSHDAEVQRAASAALGNLAVNGEPWVFLSTSNTVESYLTISGKQIAHRIAWRLGTPHPANVESQRRGAM